ncbi:hypothetical protein EAG_16231 [Camponotus floridanus]|uniref:Uncharacterized protein n=1 Tax=Camponotus floridanus TaxID=104421 RepID=E2AG59_CAMFO|nr:hypothetical protein EAG_16231 [Camponotus floridanus]
MLHVALRLKYTEAAGPGRIWIRGRKPYTHYSKGERMRVGEPFMPKGPRVDYGLGPFCSDRRSGSGKSSLHRIGLPLLQTGLCRMIGWLIVSSSTLHFITIMMERYEMKIQCEIIRLSEPKTAKTEQSERDFTPWCAIFTDDDGFDDNDDDEERNRFHPDIHLLLVVVARRNIAAGTPQEVGRNTDAETSAEKNVGIQVVDSETIREYRLMGFNDLRTLVRSDLGVSSISSFADPVKPSAPRLLRYATQSALKAMSQWRGSVIDIAVQLGGSYQLAAIATATTATAAAAAAAAAAVSANLLSSISSRQGTTSDKNKVTDYLPNRSQVANKSLVTIRCAISRWDGVDGQKSGAPAPAARTASSCVSCHEQQVPLCRAATAATIHREDTSPSSSRQNVKRKLSSYNIQKERYVHPGVLFPLNAASGGLSAIGGERTRFGWSARCAGPYAFKTGKAGPKTNYNLYYLLVIEQLRIHHRTLYKLTARREFAELI